MSAAAIKTRWQALGFETGPLPHLLLTATGSAIAMVAGVLLGLDHPQWAAMSVWAASQPFRGQVVEKGAFRMLGSCLGVVAGVAFVIASNGSPLWMMLMIAAWSTLNVLLAHLSRGYMSYGFLLAGYSAAMVGLLDFDRPQNIVHLGFDRLGTVALGVAIATLTALLFAPRATTQNHLRRAIQLCDNVLGELLHDISHKPSDEKRTTALISEAAELDETLDGQAAGSLRHRHAARSQRRLLLQLVNLVVWINRPNRPEQAEGETVANAIAEARSALSSDTPAEAAVSLFKAAEAAHSRHLGEALTRVAHAVSDLGHPRKMALPAKSPHRLHRDRLGAREAAIRTAIMMLAMGTIWTVTRWSGGPYLMLGASIMTTVFSVMDAPSRIMPYILRGVVLGVIAALACRWLVWPVAVSMGASSLDLALLTIPFIFMGPLLMTHKATKEGAFDFNMHLLLLLSPLLPLTGTPAHGLQVAAAIIAGPFTAWLAYRLIFPATLDRRLQSVARMMVEDVRQLARGDAATALKRATVWRARLEHRLLRLARWVDKTSSREISATGGAMATVLLGEAALRLHEMANSDDERLARSAHLSLNRISHLEDNTADAEHALYRTANMDGISASDRQLLLHASEALAAHPAFFAKAT